MNEDSLKQFVQNMRDRGEDDGSIAQNLEVAGHPAELISKLLAPEPAESASLEAAPEEQAVPVVDPNSRPAIIKGRSGIISQPTPPDATPGEPAQEENPGAAPPSAEEPMLASAASRVTIAPTSQDIKPASINSPSVAAAAAQSAPTPAETPPVAPATIEPTSPQPTTAPQPPEPTPVTPPTPAPPAAPVAIDNSTEAVTAATMPPQPQPAPEPAAPSIYPEATHGTRGTPPGMPTPSTISPQQQAALEGASQVQFESNPLKMLGYVFSRFFMHIPAMLFLIVFGTIVTFGFIRLTTWTGVEVFKFILSQEWLGNLVGGSLISSFAFILSVLIIIYSVIISAYLSIWRTVQFSIALDLARDDNPEIDSALKRLLTDSMQAFSVNFRLVFKLGASLFVALMLVVVIVDYDGLSGISWLHYAFYAWEFLAIILVTRNSYIHLLVLDSTGSTARNASKESVELVHKPRQKYIELLAWSSLTIILIFVIRVIVLLAVEHDTASTVAAADVLVTRSLGPDQIIYELLGLALTLVFYILYDLGLARYFVATVHSIRTARPIGDIHFLNFVAIVLAGLSLWGGNVLVNNIRRDQLERKYEARSGQYDESGYYQPDPNDYDDNGVPDDEQCGPDEYAYPVVVDYDSRDSRATYEIECT